MARTGTDQFIVLGGELSEPLVKLQYCYYGHQIPEEERKGQSCNYVFFFSCITLDKVANSASLHYRINHVTPTQNTLCLRGLYLCYV